jgi:hypothetical protein
MSEYYHDGWNAFVNNLTPDFVYFPDNNAHMEYNCGWNDAAKYYDCD